MLILSLALPNIPLSVVLINSIGFHIAILDLATGAKKAQNLLLFFYLFGN